jgi:hypothetical protein
LEAIGARYAAMKYRERDKGKPQVDKVDKS